VWTLSTSIASSASSLVSASGATSPTLNSPSAWWNLRAVTGKLEQRKGVNGKTFSIVPVFHVESTLLGYGILVLSNGQDKPPPDWPDFVGIVLLLFVNSAIGFYEEHNAGNAVKALMDSLAPKAKVKRDGSWSEIESANLVPGDMISFQRRGHGRATQPTPSMNESVYVCRGSCGVCCRRHITPQR